MIYVSFRSCGASRFCQQHHSRRLPRRRHFFKNICRKIFALFQRYLARSLQRERRFLRKSFLRSRFRKRRDRSFPSPSRIPEKLRQDISTPPRLFLRRRLSWQRFRFGNPQRHRHKNFHGTRRITPLYRRRYFRRRYFTKRTALSYRSTHTCPYRFLYFRQKYAHRDKTRLTHGDRKKSAYKTYLIPVSFSLPIGRKQKITLIYPKRRISPKALKRKKMRRLKRSRRLRSMYSFLDTNRTVYRSLPFARVRSS